MKKSREEAGWQLIEFTPRAQQALGFAEEEAKAMKLDFLGVEHLLLGLLKLGNGVAFHVLRKKELRLETARAAMLKFFGGPGAGASLDRLPPTPRLKRVIENAKKDAQSLDHTYIGTEHLLLGILAETDGLAHELLKSANIDPEAMRKEILRELAPRGIPPPTGEEK